MHPKILVLGSSGMAGHMIAQYLREAGSYEVVDAGPRRKVFVGTTCVDLENPVRLEELFDAVIPNVLVNCTGVLVQASEVKKKEAVWINSYLPHLLLGLCQARDIRLIHLSTDCVFSGKTGPYREDSPKDGQLFYDRSKALGEIEGGNAITIRTSIIGPELRSAGSGFFSWVCRQEGSARGYRKALWSGVTTLELAKFVELVVSKNRELSGLLHYSVDGGISKFDLLRGINQVFGLGLRIDPVDEPILDKRLICTREDLGMYPTGYRVQLLELKAWMSNHKELYQAGLERT